jgi:hypothetical protein
MPKPKGQSDAPLPRKKLDDTKFKYFPPPKKYQQAQSSICAGILVWATVPNIKKR